jgi:type IX secretion system PorP/SprF family membrane protein
MLNRSYLNPAYAGDGELFSITALYRSQWSGYRDHNNNAVAPELQLFTGTLNVNNTGHSVGMIFSRDKAGYLTNAQAQASYAYTIRFAQTRSLSIGIRGGMYSRTIDFSRHVIKQPDDPLIPLEKQRETYPDVSFGLWYEHELYYAGLSARSIVKAGSTVPGFSNKPAYIATAGYKAEISPVLKFLPSMQIVIDEDDFSFDAAALVNYSDVFWTGLTYRYQEAVAAVLGIGIQRSKLKVSYAFDYVTNNREVTAGTSHEIMLNFRAGEWKRRPVKYVPQRSRVKKPRKPFIKINDKDKDGVPDEKDRCNDVPGVRKFNGCPDKDMDNIPDKDDLCPDVYGSKIFFGCPDTDKDGLPDNEDECSSEAGQKELKGCPDRDEDGTSDKEDDCPDIPGLPAQRGCPVSFTQEKLAHITFTTGQATLEETSYNYLDDVIAILKQYENTKVIIEGHTDNEGEDDFNLELSKRRSETILNYFIEKGLDPERLSIEGYGETRPVDTNDTSEGRSKNRRVEIHFLKENNR